MLRRRLRTVVVFLLLGAIVNIAVAWFAANKSGEKREITRTFSDGTVERVFFPKDLEQGWPLRCLLSELDVPGGSWITSIELGITTELACWPIWPGFAINTLFYAGVLWVVFAFPFKARRWRRIKRGLCPACAYPIGSSEVCTECGTPVAPRTT